MVKKIATELRNELYIQLASIASSAASPARLRMIQLLAQSPHTVEELSQMVGESVANTSQHLRKLLDVGLVRIHKEGVFRRYRIASHSVLSFWESLQDLASDVGSEFEQTRLELINPTLIAPFDLKQVRDLVSSKTAILVDVREADETFASPVDKSVSVPAAEILKGNHKFSKKQTLLLFCRGRLCTMANPAVQSLRDQGFKSYRLQESPHKLNTIWKGI